MPKTAGFLISDVLAKGWEDFKKHAGFLVCTYVIVTVLCFALLAPFIILEIQAIFEKAWERHLITLLVRILFEGIVGTWFALGIITVNLKIIRGETPSFLDLYTSAGKFFTAYLAWLFLILAVILGFLALIIPAYFIMLIVIFYMWFIVDRDMGVMDSIWASIDATRGSRWRLLLLLMLFWALSVLAAIPCGLGLFIVGPWSILSLTHVYETLASKADASEESTSRAAQDHPALENREEDEGPAAPADGATA